MVVVEVEKEEEEEAAAEEEARTSAEENVGELRACLEVGARLGKRRRRN